MTAITQDESAPLLLSTHKIQRKLSQLICSMFILCTTPASLKITAAYMNLTGKFI